MAKFAMPNELGRMDGKHRLANQRLILQGERKVTKVIS